MTAGGSLVAPLFFMVRKSNWSSHRAACNWEEINIAAVECVVYCAEEDGGAFYNRKPRMDGDSLRSNQCGISLQLEGVGWLLLSLDSEE